MELVKIKKLNNIFIQICCEKDLQMGLYDYFSYFVPGYRFTPTYRNKLWDGKIRLFRLKNSTIYVGLLNKVIEFLEHKNVKYVVDQSLRQKFVTKEYAKKFVEAIPLPYPIRDYQKNAAINAIVNSRQLLLSPTGSGKSLIIYVLAMWYLYKKCKILIIVPTTSLTKQLYSDFQEYSKNNRFNPETSCTTIYSGQEKYTNHPVKISTWQSIIALIKKDPKYLHQFTAVIVDECHGAKSKSLVSILENMINAVYRVGMTGTLDGSVTHENVITGLLGDVVEVSKTVDLIAQEYLSELEIQCHILKYPESLCREYRKMKYADEVKMLNSNEFRNLYIVNLAKIQKSNTLILFRFIETHGKIIEFLLKEALPERNIYFVTGNTKVNARELVRKTVETESNAIILASVGVFSTGINIKNLDNIILASPTKSKIQLLQGIGRTLRISPTGNSAVVHDIVDDIQYKSHTNYTYQHFLERLAIYTREQMKYKVLTKKL